jgi:hypothetical protein
MQVGSLALLATAQLYPITGGNAYITKRIKILKESEKGEKERAWGREKRIEINRYQRGLHGASSDRTDAHLCSHTKEFIPSCLFWTCFYSFRDNIFGYPNFFFASFSNLGILLFVFLF